MWFVRDGLTNALSAIVFLAGVIWLEPAALAAWTMTWLVAWSFMGIASQRRLLGRQACLLAADSVLLGLSVAVVVLAPPRALESWAGRGCVIPLALASALVGVRACRTRRDRLLLRTAHLRGAEHAFESVARELHDDTLQSLAAATMRLRTADHSNSHGVLVDASRSVCKLIDEQISTLRGLARGLRPARLHQDGLRAALRQLAEEASETWGVAVDVEVIERRRCAHSLDPAYELTAYRVIQEALSNAVRHSRATRICVRVLIQRFVLMGEVTDNGLGFAASECRGRSGMGGMGLETMRERVEQAGGKLSIRSSVHGGSKGLSGTRVRFLIPVGSVESPHEPDCGQPSENAVFPQLFPLFVDPYPDRENSYDR
jgi:signal transduction histidine kinase